MSEELKGEMECENCQNCEKPCSCDCCEPEGAHTLHPCCGPCDEDCDNVEHCEPNLPPFSEPQPMPFKLKVFHNTDLDALVDEVNEFFEEGCLERAICDTKFVVADGTYFMQIIYQVVKFA